MAGCGIYPINRTVKIPADIENNKWKNLDTITTTSQMMFGLHKDIMAAAKTMEGVKNVNKVADKVSARIRTWAKGLTEEGHLLIVGGDEILPFYRLPDPDKANNYHFWGYDAGFMDYYHSDAVYADTADTGPYTDLYHYIGNIGENYFSRGVTDISYGRIVGASVSDMISLITRGLDGPSGNENAVIASTTYVEDFEANVDMDEVVSMLKEYVNINGNNFRGDESDSVISSDPMIESDDWKCSTLTEALSNGAMYVVTGSHGLHSKLELYHPVQQEAGEPELSDSVSQEADDCSTGFFAGANIGKQDFLMAMMSCFSGTVVEDGMGDITSCIPYVFINKGACALLGGSQIVNCDPGAGKLAYGEMLINLFFKHLGPEKSIGTSFKDALDAFSKQKMPDKIFGVNQSAEEKKWKKQVALTEFNLYGIPWMKPNLPSDDSDDETGKTEAKSSDGKGLSATISAPKRLSSSPVRSSARSGGTFTRSFTLTVTDYEIEQEDAYETVEIPGSETNLWDCLPVLPFFMETLELPKDSEVVSVRMTGGTSESLGQLNIPAFQSSAISNPQPHYTDITCVTGLYPEQCWGHRTDPSGGSYGDRTEVTVYLMPVQHNVDTKETTLWTEMTVEVEYRVSECVFISGFGADKETYKASEDVTATVTLENVGDTDISGLTAVLNLEDTADHALETGLWPVGTLPAGESIRMELSAGNGQRTDSYILMAEIRDESGRTLASSRDEWIRIVSERISEILTEESQAGDDVPITVVCENFSSQDITPEEVCLTIEDSDGERVAGFTMFGLTIPAGGYEDAVFFWDTSGEFTGAAPALPGRYCARAELFMGFDSRFAGPVCFTLTSPGDINGDLVTDMADFILAMRILVSENIGSVTPGSTGTDGKIGLDDVLRILREIAEDMPVSP